MATVTNLLVNGLATGMLVFLLAAGLTLIFVTRIIALRESFMSGYKANIRDIIPYTVREPENLLLSSVSIISPLRSKQAGWLDQEHKDHQQHIDSERQVGNIIRH